jgi:four helix bundle protein
MGTLGAREHGSGGAGVFGSTGQEERGKTIRKVPRGAMEMSSRGRIESHEELDVYQLAFKAAMRVFELSRSFPREETYSLTDQISKSSRSVCSNISESWRKRRYEAAFVSKLTDAEMEAAETQTWLKFAVACGYLSPETAKELGTEYDFIIGKLVNMINRPEPWILRGPKRNGSRNSRMSGR